MRWKCGDAESEEATCEEGKCRNLKESGVAAAVAAAAAAHLRHVSYQQRRQQRREGFSRLVDPPCRSRETLAARGKSELGAKKARRAGRRRKTGGAGASSTSRAQHSVAAGPSKGPLSSGTTTRRSMRCGGRNSAEPETLADAWRFSKLPRLSGQAPRRDRQKRSEVKNKVKKGLARVIANGSKGLRERELVCGTLASSQ